MIAALGTCGKEKKGIPTQATWLAIFVIVNHSNKKERKTDRRKKPNRINDSLGF